MKTLKYFFSFLILISIYLLNGCGSDDPVAIDPKEERLQELSATWNFNTVTQSSVDISSEFTGATLTLSGSKSFSTTNIGDPYNQIWPASGSFEFGNGGSNLNVMVIKDIDMTIVSISATGMTLSFPFTTANTHNGGRISSLDGDYVVTFTVQ